MIINYINFNSKLNSLKPRDYDKPKDDNYCAFCDHKKLKTTNEFIFENDKIIHMKNAFPNYENSFPTVLIETIKCDRTFSNYNYDHTVYLLDYSFKYIEKLKKENKYKSILFFKNHGPLSGGSLTHPHMQIIGLENIDFYENIKLENLEGLEIFDSENISLNISTKPLTEYHEFNLSFPYENYDIYLKKVAHYINRIFNFIIKEMNCLSLNMCFYFIDNKVHIKFVCRKNANTIIFTGFKISAVPDDLDIISKNFNNFLRQ